MPSGTLAIVQVTPLTVVQDKPLLSVARAPLDGPFTVTVIVLDVASIAYVEVTRLTSPTVIRSMWFGYGDWTIVSV